MGRAHSGFKRETGQSRPGLLLEPALLLQQFLERMDELIQARPLEDTLLTQPFILQKYPNPARTFPHPTRTAVVPEETHRVVNRNSLVVFNQDCKFYTPAFIDPAEKEALLALDAEMQEGFEEKIEAASSKGIILVPKPSSNYCFVCHEHFTDYLKHLDHPVHHKNVQGSHRQDLIEELLQEFGRKRRSPSGFAEAIEGRKRVKLEDSQVTRSKADALFKDVSTNLPLSSPSKVKFNKS